MRELFSHVRTLEGYLPNTSETGTKDERKPRCGQHRVQETVAPTQNCKEEMSQDEAHLVHQAQKVTQPDGRHQEK